MMMRTCSGTYCQSSFRKYLIFWIESAFSTLSSDVHQSTLTEGERCIFPHLGRDNILAIFHLIRNPNLFADYDADYVLWRHSRICPPTPTPSNMSRVCVSRQSSRLSLHLVLVPLTQYVSWPSSQAGMKVWRNIWEDRGWLTWFLECLANFKHIGLQRYLEIVVPTKLTSEIFVRTWKGVEGSGTGMRCE